jgi:hypothetical protein
VCDQPLVAGGAQLKIKSSADPGKDRVFFKWAKGNPAYPPDVYYPRLCVYDRSGGNATLAYQGSPSGGTWTYRLSSSFSLKFKSKDGLPEGVTAVNLKLNATTATKHTGQVKARGDLVLAFLCNTIRRWWRRFAGHRACVGGDLLVAGEERRSPVLGQIGLTVKAAVRRLLHVDA